MRIIHQPSDKLFKQSLLDKRVFKELFENHIPLELKQLIDFNDLTHINNSFIDETFKGLEADVLYAAKLINQDALAYLYLLCEHQGDVDYIMAFRLLVYITRIMDMHIKKYPNSPLPLVYPLVMYSGEKQWNAPLDIFGLFGEQAEMARKTFLSPYQLIDVNRIPDEDIKKNFWIGLIEYVLKYRKTKNFNQFLNTLLPWLRELEKQDGTDLAKIVIRYVIDAIEANDEALFIKKSQTYLSDELKGEIMTLAQRFEEKGMEKGKQEGKQEEKAEIAIKILKEGFDVQTASKLTGLSIEKLKHLKETIH